MTTIRFFFIPNTKRTRFSVTKKFFHSAQHSIQFRLRPAKLKLITSLIVSAYIKVVWLLINGFESSVHICCTTHTIRYSDTEPKPLVTFQQQSKITIKIENMESGKYRICHPPEKKKTYYKTIQNIYEAKPTAECKWTYKHKLKMTSHKKKLMI